jgi:hypothetical protein
VLPEDVYGTNSLAVAVSSDSSNDSADEYTAIGQQLHGEIPKLKRRCKDLEHDLYVVHGHVAAERDRRKALEAHIRGNDLMYLLLNLNATRSSSVSLTY